ncbi:nitroreductase/quinone reductase family protein [Micromonospora okii]|uniref:nitroreductase/quinone reductase family protein n=1 Tax=Micromonospora okii TaxID=1182970 RepID=UPI001E54641E|nr:nitroreductase/quinone reductase family protein [Micromonospora okii]
MTLLQKAARVINRIALPLVSSPAFTRLTGNRMTVVTYTGRRSGRSFSIPVAYRRAGDRVSIDVMLPDQKSWWRNFTKDGGPIAVRIDGIDRAGHAVALRQGERVRVEVELLPPPQRSPSE